MAFTVQGIFLADFRNYTAFSWRDLGSINIFVGPNAIGKSNILEAIQLTTALDSFRRPQVQELVRWEQSTGAVKITAVDESRVCEIRLLIEDGKKQYFFNGKKASRGDIAGKIPAVSFCPDDLRLVKDGATGRRKAIDAIGSQVSKNYRQVKRDYERIIAQKNNLLKDQVDPLYLQSVNDTVMRIGLQLYLYRQNIGVELGKRIAEIYPRITGKDECAALYYVPSWQKYTSIEFDGAPLTREQASLSLRKALECVLEEELRSRRSLVGPHRDQPCFRLNGKDASVYASQGQQRSLALAFKIAELQYIQDVTDRRPLLLLDDVMSELDERHRRAFMGFISEEIQTFITTTNLSYFDDEELANAVIIDLESLKERSNV